MEQTAKVAGIRTGRSPTLIASVQRAEAGGLKRAEGRFFLGASVEGISRADTRQAERADFRATGHAHAVGLCLLSRLGGAERLGRTASRLRTLVGAMSASFVV